MKRANVIRGRIEQHAEGLGTPDREMVRTRAREIAVTNGRRAEQATEADLQQAREELLAAQNAPANSIEEEEDEFIPREGPIGVSSGRAARTKQPTDEQTLPEELVAEGLEEAAHDRMVEGNKRSRRLDETFDDQLPPSSS